MAPSPRKPTPSTFDRTWHETDTAFLHPTSLPISKVPRAWERKQETSSTRDGKQRKIWRRYTLRSQLEQTVSMDEAEIKEENSQARAIKKLRVRPDQFTEITTISDNKGRAFKATRWDRRKSALPSTVGKRYTFCYLHANTNFREITFPKRAESRRRAGDERHSRR